MDNDRKKAESVVSNPVQISTRKKVRDAFIKNDGKTVRDYAIFDVFIPSVKRTIYDLLTKILGMSLFGGKAEGSAFGSTGYSNQYQQVVYKAGEVNYRPYNSSPQPRPQQSYPLTGFEYESWVFKDRGDIEAVLNQLTDMIEVYGFVTIVDLYDSVNKTAPYTAENYGWRSMNGCEPVLCSGGWRLKMTKPSPIK